MPARPAQVRRRPLALVTLALALAVLLAACGRQAAPSQTPDAAPPEPGLAAADATDLFLSEYVEGSSVNKAIEIYNGTGADVDLTEGGYTLRLYFNGADTFTEIALSGVIAAGDVYVVADDGAEPAVLAEADLTPSNSFFNGDDVIVLAKDGTVLDVFGQLGVDPGSEWGSGATGAGDATLRRKPAVCAGDPDGTDAFDPADAWDGYPQNAFDGLGSHVADCDGTGDGDGGDDGDGDPTPSPIGLCGDPATLIHEIQGPGGATPLAGQVVIIEGIVVGDVQRGDGDATGTDLGGFFVQEEDADADGDPVTSDGIFVYAPSAPDLRIGDVVRIEGTAGEYFDHTQLSGVDTVVTCATDAPLPTATEVTLPLTATGDLEAVEGMRVTFPQTLRIAEFFDFDRYGEIVLSADVSPFGRPYQPTAVPTADPEAAARANRLARIVVDDASDAQNPAVLPHPNGAPFTLDNRFRGGDEVARATGVITFNYGEYKLLLTQAADYVAANPRPGAPEPVGGSVTVASLNVLNYFSTLGSAGSVCGPLANQDCRGADDANELERQGAKIFAALEGLDADVVGLVEIENDAADAAVQHLVDGLNAHLGADTYAAIETGPVGPDAIRVALIYKPATVTPIGAFAVLDDPAFLDPAATGEARNRAALAQTFAPAGGGDAVTVVVNHLKSKGSACGPGDDDAVQGNCNLTRTLAVRALMDWLAGDPTGSGDPDVLLIGDYNAYDEEDPVAELLAAGWSDLLEDEVGEDAYTYVFDGQLGHLDYAFANAALADRVTDATAWAINADEPDVLDYDTTFKPPTQDALYAPDAYRSSDHDPVLIGLELRADAAPVCTDAYAAIGSLWPADHRLVDGAIEGAFDPDGDPLTLRVTQVFQDEPVDGAGDGAGDGATRPDAVLGEDGAFALRAERDARGDGRVYHVTFEAQAGTASCTGTVRVSVDRDRGRNGAPGEGGPRHAPPPYAPAPPPPPP